MLRYDQDQLDCMHSDFQMYLSKFFLYLIFQPFLTYIFTDDRLDITVS